VIFGIGIDTIEVSRIQRSIETYGDQFLHRIYSEGEIRYCSRKPRKYEHFAARFAAKEAYAKALGTGVRRKFVWRHVAVRNEISGRPFITLEGEMEERAKGIIGRPFKVYLSITHTKDIAEAIVTIEMT
jgi:holo-[acyl-carrier protein] synthase